MSMKYELKSENILAEDHKYLTFLKKVFRHEFRKNSFKRISVPDLIESDFLENIFKDNLGNFAYKIWDFCLNSNPEIFSLKAYLSEPSLKEALQPIYSYHMDSFYPKTDSNISQSILFAWDVIWEDDPIIDAQLIFITRNILKKIWLDDNVIIKINSMWLKKEQDKYKQDLIDFLSSKSHILSDETKKNIEINPFFIFKSEIEDEQILAQSAPSIIKSLKKDSKEYYSKFKQYLDILWVPYIEDKSLFSMLPYVNNSIWNIFVSDKNVSEGYSCNHLSILLWEQKETSMSSFYINIDKIIDILKEKQINIKNKDKLDLYFVQLWDEAKKIVLPLSLEARNAWINTSVSLWTPSVKEQMLKANKSGAKFLVIVWVMEARNGIFQLRDLEAGTQTEINKDDLISFVIGKIWKDKLDFYEPSKDLLQN